MPRAANRKQVQMIRRAGDADLQKLGAGVEDGQKPLGRRQEDVHPGGHDDQGDGAAQAEGGEHPLFVPGAVVVAQNGKSPWFKPKTGMNTKDCSLK